MAKPTNFFNSLTGIPVNYDRPPLAPYGSRGVKYDFHVTEDFENLLEECFNEIWQLCPFGKGNVITSAGAFVDKPNSYHNSGQAFDLDGIHWDDKSFVCLNFPSDTRFYLGIEAVLRKYFPTILDYHYNLDHRDHLHVDVGGIIEFRQNTKSKVFFLQAALSYVLGIPVKIDGGWGTETSKALKKALEQLDISGDLEEKKVWFEFLARVAEIAFDKVPVAEDKSATVLLRDFYSVISHELSENPARKRIETALTAFVSHPALKKILDESRENNAKKVVVSSKTVAGKINWSAVVDGEPEFYVGTEFSYADQNTKGIFNYRGIKYNPADYRVSYGFWADFIYPTAVSESAGGRFNCLNTWDRAFFTFGFMQFAAHVYNGDFANYFRALLALPEAARYFPDLIVKDNLIYQKTAGGLVKLEAEDSETKPSPLMKYLNPTSTAVEKTEVEQAARFIHWTENSAESRNIQVRVGVETFRRILSSRAATYGLDGMVDKVCLVVADIHHHGRGKTQQIKTALDTNGDTEVAYENLLKIGYTKWKERIDTIRKTVGSMVQQGKLEKMKYSKAQSNFVPLS